MTFTWQFKSFSDLSNVELYALLRLRSEVFVVEQNCVFLDMDNKDQHCLHLLGWQGNQLAACARIVPAGISFAEASVGRVVTAAFARGTGLGRELMQTALNKLYDLYGRVPVYIGAQQHLQTFYASLGFEATGQPYNEDGIMHIEMLKPV